jgi:hypothetical protein
MVHWVMSPKREHTEQPTEEKSRDYSERLAELESELSDHPARRAGTPQSALPSLCRVEAGRIGDEAVVQFVHRGKAFAIGHTDIAFPGTNGTRGIRRIHFYDTTKKIVLGVTGEFDNHQFGANFRSPELKAYCGGAWETSFLAVTTGLRTFRADRKEELRQIRARTTGRRA